MLMRIRLQQPWQQWLALSLFLVGVAATIVALQIPTTAAALRNLEQSGYFGVLIAGAMYGLGLTSAIAAVIFANIPDTLNPWAVALMGGFGSMMYDLSVFSLTRHQHVPPRLVRWLRSIATHRSMPRWVSLAIGGLIFASPLPDELATTYLGLAHVSPRAFIPISFFFNTLGILIITELF